MIARRRVEVFENRERGRRQAEAERRERTRSAALLRVAAALNEEWSLDSLMVVFAETAAEAVGANRASVYAYDETQTRTVSSALFGYSPEGQVRSVAAHLSPLDVPAEAEVLRTGLPLRRLDATAFPNPGSLPDWTSDVVVPLKAEGRVQGALYVWEANRHRAFSDDEIALLQAIGQQAGLAILRGRDAQAAQRLAAIRAAVLAMSRSLASAGDLGTMLAALADELADLVPYDEVTLFRLSADGTLLEPILNRVTHADLGHHPPPVLRRGEGLVSQVLVTAEAALINDAHLDPRSHYTEQKEYRDRGEHVLQAPLTVAGDVIGALQLSRLGGAPFSEDELTTFRVFAEQAAVAIRNGALLADAQAAHDRARRHAADLETVLETTRAITAQPDLQRTLGTLADHLEELIPHEILVVGATDGRGVLTPLLGRIEGTDAPIAWDVELDRGVIGRIMRSGAPGMVNDANQASDAVYPAAFPRRSGPEHMLIAPLVVSGETIGAMILDRFSECPFRDEEFALFQVLAGQAAVALQASFLYEEERRRRRQATALVEVAAALNGAGTLDDVVSTLAAAAADALAIDRCSLFVFDESGEQTIAAYFHGYPELEKIEEERRIPPSALPIERELLRSGRPIRGARLAELRGAAPEDNPFGMRGGAVLPLRIRGAVQGALYAWSSVPTPGGAPREFSDDEMALLEAICDQAGVAVERARLHAAAERQARNLETVLESSRLLAMQTEFEATLETFGDGVHRLAPYSAIAVFRAEIATGELRRIHSRASPGLQIPVERFSAQHGITGDAFHRREAVCLERAERDPRIDLSYYEPATRAQIEAEGLHVMAVPLLVEGYPFGVVTISRVDQAPFTEEEFATVQVFAGQAAAALRSAELLARNRDLYLGGVRALASAVDAKDPYTRGHSQRVSRLAGRIATAMGLDRADAEAIALAGLLHDIGKIGVPDAVLQKPGTLDDAERAVMMSHAQLGATILAGARTDALLPLMPLVRHHHEWFDGGGYPDGLSGAKIPLGASIIAVADAFDTMVTDRPYRQRGSVDVGVAELRRGSGAQFDPKVVEAFAALVEEDDSLRTAIEADVETWPHAEDRTEGRWQHLADREFGAGGLMGEARALGLLLELAVETRHIPDLRQFLHRVAAIVQRRLDYEDVMLMLVDRERSELAMAAHAGQMGFVDPDYRQPLDVGVCGQVIRSGRPRNVVDVRYEPDFHAPLPEEPPLGSELVVPLIVDGETIGVINVESVRPAAFTAADEAVLVAVAGQVATAVHVAQLHDAAKRAASTDGLTGLANHRAFYDLLGKAVREGERLSVVILDVEGLKQVNDSAGHLAGDRLLRRVADVIRRTVRADDLVARYGGDEFAIVMRGLGRREASRAAARVRRELREATDELGTPGPTVRYGVASFPDDGTRPNELVGAADRRLYEMRAEHVSMARSRLLAGD